MNLKEAFRYQKFLRSLMTSAEMHLNESSFANTQTYHHYIGEANPDAEDKIEVIEPATNIVFVDVIKIAEVIIDERERLCSAINKAKSECEIDIDAVTESNKFRREVYHYLKKLLEPKRKLQDSTGSAYKFDVNGVQVPYRYRIGREVTEMYDRADVRSITTRLISDADINSQKVDMLLTNTIVDFEPKFNVNDSFQDVMESFSARITEK